MVESGLAANYGAFTRGTWNTIPVPAYDSTFLNELVNQTLFWSGQLTSSSSILVACGIEPFLPSAIASGTTETAAYPYTREKVYSPTLMSMYWLLPSSDTEMFSAMNSSIDTLVSVLAAADDGAATGVPYNNYAASTTTLEELYGTNLDRLMEIKERIDPKNIMGLAGGFKILPTV